MMSLSEKALATSEPSGGEHRAQGSTGLASTSSHTTHRTSDVESRSRDAMTNRQTTHLQRRLRPLRGMVYARQGAGVIEQKSADGIVDILPVRGRVPKASCRPTRLDGWRASRDAACVHAAGLARWSARAGERVKASITRYLTSQLKLKVNESKSRVCGINEVVFLGFTFRGRKLRWSDKSFATFKHRVRRLTGRSWGVSMDYRFRKLAEYVRGWMNYYGISEYYRPVPEIDKWIRRRIRMCYWK